MMVVGALLFAVVVMFALRADAARLKSARLRYEILLPIGLVVQFTGPRFVPEGSAVVAAWIAGAVLVLIMAAANWHLIGFRVIALGLVLNALVILANGGMPVSTEALRYLGAHDVEAVIAAASPLYVLADSSTLLLVLGDVVPVPGPAPVRSLLSLGDALLMVGVVAAVLQITDA